MNWTIRYAHSISRRWIIASMLLGMLYPTDPQLDATLKLVERLQRASRYLMERMGRDRI